VAVYTQEFMDISEEEIDRLLDEVGAPAKGVKVEETSLENLLGQLIDSPPVSFSLPKKEVLKRKRASLLPLALSLAVLGGFLGGSIFGFYWGKTQRVDPSTSSFEEMNAKLSLLITQIREMHDKLIPTLPAQQLIEPIEPPDEIEKLAPEHLM
jgi:hypothetical protein